MCDNKLMSRNYCYLLLTCAKGEEKKLVDALLDKRLIACAKCLPTESAFWFRGVREMAEEVVILMDTAEDLYDEIETEVAKLHSYDTFVLTQIPINRMNLAAEQWLESELKSY